MRETEILRGLHKSREGCYANGAVPNQRPSMTSRMVGRLTGGAFGYTSPAKKTESVAVKAVMSNEGGIGNAARNLSNRKKQLEAAIGYKNGMTPHVDKAGVIHGPGTSTSDSVVARVSKDEAILPAKTVDAIGVDNLATIIEKTNGRPPSRGLKGRVDSGTIGGNTHSNTKNNGVDSGRIGHADGYIDELNKANSLGDKVRAQAAQAQSLNNANATRAAAPTNSIFKPTGRAVGATLKAGNLVSGAARAVTGAGITPALTIKSAYDSYNKPTSEFQAETGIQNELGARTAGVLSDLGNTLTGGLAGKAGSAISNYFNSSSESAAQPAQPAQTTAQGAPITPPPTTPSLPAAVPIAPPVQQTVRGDQARALQSAVRSGETTMGDFAPGTGLVIANNENTGQPSATNIDTRGGLRGGQPALDPAQPQNPYDEVRDLQARAARLDGDGTAKGELEAHNLRRQAKATLGITKDEQDNLTRRAAQTTNQGLADQLKLATNSRAERTADQQAADSFSKRLNERFPDAVDGDGKKVDNSAKRAEIKKTLDATIAKLPKEEQDKLFNPATGFTRGVEGLDPKTLERLLFNLDVRDRVNESGSGILNSLSGNQGGDLSDNLLDYDLENAVRQGDMLVFPNGARINASDLQYDEGPANPLLPDSLFKTRTSKFTSRLRQGQGGR